jgi:hypothetical protein
VIGRIDFLRIAPPSLVRSLFELMDESYMSEEDIGMDYREQHEWNDFKEKVMKIEYENVEKEKKQRKQHIMEGNLTQ